jgi:hypothetical protein
VSAKLIAGRVIRARVNPKDCISCVDVVDKLGYETTNWSFDQVVRVALSSLLESVRQNNVIPTRDGFEYSAMVTNRFKSATRANAAKLKITAIADSLAHAQQTSPLVPQSAELRLANMRVAELELKRSAGEPWTIEDQQEYAKSLILIADS